MKRSADGMVQGKYYRNRSTEVTYVPAKSRWIQTGIPHSSEALMGM